MRRLRDWLTCFVPAVPWLITAVLIVAVLMILVSALRPKAHAQFGGVQQPMFASLSTAADWPAGLITYFDTLDTNDLTLVGGSVTNWKNKVTASDPAWQTNSSMMPVWTNGVVIPPFTTSPQFRPGTNATGWVAFRNDDFLQFFPGVIALPVTTATMISVDYNGVNIQRMFGDADSSAVMTEDQLNAPTGIGVSGCYSVTADIKTGSHFFSYWYVIVAVHGANGSITRMWTNSVYVGDVDTSARSCSLGDPFKLGKSDGNAVYEGIARFMMWNRALSSNECVTVSQRIIADFGFPYSAEDESILAKYDLAALGLNDGDAISSVPDDGPYNYDLGMTTASMRPYWSNNVSVINNQGFAVFDGSNDLLTNAFSASYPQPTHIFLVSSSRGNAGVHAAMFDANSNTQVVWENNADGVIKMYAGSAVTGPDIAENQWRVWEVLFSGASSYIKTNNVTLLTGNPGAGARAGVWLGADSFYVDAFKGDIAYALFCTNDLSNWGASQIVTNLGNRFGITVFSRN